MPSKNLETDPGGKEYKAIIILLTLSDFKTKVLQKKF